MRRLSSKSRTSQPDAPGQRLSTRRASLPVQRLDSTRRLAESRRTSTSSAARAVNIMQAPQAGNVTKTTSICTRRRCCLTLIIGGLLLGLLAAVTGLGVSSVFTTKQKLEDRIVVFTELPECDVRRYPPIDCRSCQNQHFQSFSGECNNKVSPLVDRSNSGFSRLVPAEYENKINSPKGWVEGRLYNDHPLPSTAAVALVLLPFYTKAEKPGDRGELFPHFAQFLSFDLFFFAPQQTHTNQVQRQLSCGASCQQVEPCYPIQLLQELPLHQLRADRSKACLSYTRTLAVCPSTRALPWEQKNLASPFLDASMIYASTAELNAVLRDPQDKSFLKEAKRPSRRKKRQILPGNLPGLLDKSCVDLASLSVNRSCLGLGTERNGIDSTFSLTALHEVFMREHNRLAAVLKQNNPRWSSNYVFMSARQIVIAQLQHVVNSEFLPLLLPQWAQRTYSGYNESLRATVSNAFASVAYPLLYTQHADDLSKYQQSIMRLLESYLPTSNPSNSTASARTRRQAAQDITKNEAFSALTTLLQRGRDHALGSYNSYRRRCSLPPLTWQHITLLTDAAALRALRSLYKDVDNLDLVSGLVLEKAGLGLNKAATLHCILGESFIRLRASDRFWFEADGIFTSAQLSALRNVTLAKLLCDNIEQVDKIPLWMLRAASQTTVLPCQELPALNLDLWSGPPEYTGNTCTS